MACSSTVQYCRRSLVPSFPSPESGLRTDDDPEAALLPGRSLTHPSLSHHCPHRSTRITRTPCSRAHPPPRLGRRRATPQTRGIILAIGGKSRVVVLTQFYDGYLAGWCHSVLFSRGCLHSLAAIDIFGLFLVIVKLSGFGCCYGRRFLVQYVM
jgi:hypothetical protein